MKNFMKGIITFVFALMIMLPISVFAATEITQEDFDTAKGGTPTKGITYSEGDFKSYNFTEGEYTFSENIDPDDALIMIEDTDVTLDLNEKELNGTIVILGDSNVTITGNGTVNGEVYANGFEDEDGKIVYSHLNIKNGTFKRAINLEYTNAVIDDGTFDSTEANSDSVYVNSGSSIEINGGTFKSYWNGLTAEPSYNIDPPVNVKSVVINGGTFTATDESGFSAFGLDSLEINGGTFTGGQFGFRFGDVEKITVKGGTFTANGENPIGGIYTYGDNEELLTAILGKGCEFDPALVATVKGEDSKTISSQNEISVVNPTANTYKFTEGENLEYNSETDDVATFRINTEFKYFENGGKVYVDDTLVESTNYTAESGSTIIKFTKEYMKSLASGDHTLKVEFNNGKTATTKFIVKGATTNTTNPQTLDNITTYVSVLFIGLMAIVSTLYLIKKSEN